LIDRNDILEKAPKHPMIRDGWVYLLDAIEAGDKEKYLPLLADLADDQSTMMGRETELRIWCEKASEQFAKMAKDRSYRSIKEQLKQLSKALDPDIPPHQLNLFGDN